MDNNNDIRTEAEQMPTEEENVVSETEAEQPQQGEEKSSKADKKKLKRLESELAEAQKSLEGAKADAEAANDKYVRLFAEYDNYRKRTAKERDGIYTDAYVDALCQLLPVLDNLERAIPYVEAADESDQLAKGVSMTLKSFYETLAKMGVSEIEAKGKPFDPNLHNAVMHEEDESLGENIVTEVFMKGYIKGERVLRHAMVKVAN